MGDKSPDSQSGVGYRRPPTGTRFQPGTSGNPGGRPKRRPSFRSALLAELAAPTPEKDSPARSKLEALVSVLVGAAIAGNSRAQSLLVGVLTRIGEPEARQSESLSPEDRDILDAYVGGELKRHANKPDLGHDKADTESGR